MGMGIWDIMGILTALQSCIGMIPHTTMRKVIVVAVLQAPIDVVAAQVEASD